MARLADVLRLLEMQLADVVPFLEIHLADMFLNLEVRTPQAAPPPKEKYVKGGKRVAVKMGEFDPPPLQPQPRLSRHGLTHKAQGPCLVGSRFRACDVDSNCALRRDHDL